MQIRLMPSSWVRPTQYDQGVLYDAANGRLPDNVKPWSIGNWYISALDCNYDNEISVWDMQLMYEMVRGIYTPI